MKIINNGKQITEQEDQRLVDSYCKQNLLILVLTLSIVLLGLGTYNSSKASQNESIELTRHDLGGLKGYFKLGVDLDALSYAVGRQETGNCAIETNFTVINNCHGIKIGGRPARFPAIINGQRWETSGDYFKDLWSRKYRGEVTFDKAVKYSGNDRANYWYENVSDFYAEATKTKLTF